MKYNPSPKGNRILQREPPSSDCERRLLAFATEEGFQGMAESYLSRPFGIVSRYVCAHFVCGMRTFGGVVLLRVN